MEWLSEIFGFITPVRAIIGIIIIFFLPGFTWTLVFFRGKQVNIIERLALSFGLSIAIVTTSIIALNKLIGVKITTINSGIIILIVTVIPVIIYFFDRLIHRRRDDTVKS